MGEYGFVILQLLSLTFAVPVLGGFGYLLIKNPE
jgi:hypothetical protein